MAASSTTKMGFAPGGQISQKVVTDPHGLEVWDTQQFGTLIVHVLNTAQHEAITGRSAPPPVISARTYTDHGFPWFRHYEEEAIDVPASETLAALSSIAELVGMPEHRVDVAEPHIVDLNKKS